MKEEKSGWLDRLAPKLARTWMVASWLIVGLCLSMLVIGWAIKDNGVDAVDGQAGLAQNSDADTATDAPPVLPDARPEAGAAGVAEPGAGVAAPAGDGAAGAAARPAEPKVEPAADAAPVEPVKSDDKGDGGSEVKAPPGQVDTTTDNPHIRKSEGDWMSRAFSFLGIFVFVFLAWLMSNDRKKVNWRLVGMGTLLQIVFAVLIHTSWGQAVFTFANDVVLKLLSFTNDGGAFIFASFLTGKVEGPLVNFAFVVLPTIIFFSSLMTVLYHLGVMQFVVKGMAWVMFRTMGTSGAESLSAAANIFVGQTEAPLVVKPFIEKMTKSELMTVMTGGFATVAGGVMAAYVGMLSQYFPDIAGHLIAASVMSAPAALVIGKIMYPEDGKPETLGKLEMSVEKPDANMIEAAARGAGEGLKLALNVGGMLLAFVALVAMVNYLIGWPFLTWNASELGTLVEHFKTAGLAIPDGCGTADGAAQVHTCLETMRGAAGAPEVTVLPVITFEVILGYLFAPIAFIMGVPWVDCLQIGQLLGTKMVLNEFVAYTQMSTMLQTDGVVLYDRSVIIATYALCGFANFGSIAIQIGGLGGIAPSRQSDLARLGFRAMIAGSIAAFMTATIAGILA